MAKVLNNTILEKSRRLYKKPVRRVYSFQISFVVLVPNLGAQRFIQVNEPLHFLFEGANGHGICHSYCKGMMVGEIVLDVFEVVVPEKQSSSRVMAFKGGNIKNEVIM